MSYKNIDDRNTFRTFSFYFGEISSLFGRISFDIPPRSSFSRPIRSDLLEYRSLIGRENLITEFVWEDITIFVIQVLYREGWITFDIPPRSLSSRPIRINLFESRSLIGRKNLTTEFVWEDIIIFVIQALYTEGWIMTFISLCLCLCLYFLQLYNPHGHLLSGRPRRHF